MSVIIRLAESKDHDGLYKLWDEFGRVYTKEVLLEPLGLKWLETYKDEPEVIGKITQNFISDKKYICFVAEDSGELVGFICGTIHDMPEKIFCKKGYIEDWFVTARYRHRGIGSLLYDALIQEFDKDNCEYLELDTYVSNKAIERYYELGFADASVKMVKKLRSSVKEEK